MMDPLGNFSPLCQDRFLQKIFFDHFQPTLLHRHEEGHMPDFTNSKAIHSERFLKPRCNLITMEILNNQENLINHIIPENTPLLEWNKLLSKIITKNK